MMAWGESPPSGRVSAQMMSHAVSMKAPVLCLDCREHYMELDLQRDHQHLTCPGCERVWCAVCIARIEVPISEEWQRRRRVAHLN
jgi:hypothetical protein